MARWEWVEFPIRTFVEARLLCSINEMDGQKEVVDDDVELSEDESTHSYSIIHECAVSKPTVFKAIGGNGQVGYLGNSLTGQYVANRTFYYNGRKSFFTSARVKFLFKTQEVAVMNIITKFRFLENRRSDLGTSLKCIWKSVCLAMKEIRADIIEEEALA
uniref:Uncharacterized protein n=1 Tax=Tanacetum cinerariifolium TaxID=118510 RepID=A0A6L2L829_TANCI|nr:hypothetical protein [Tanacetum cinerariifolium]